MAHDRLGTTKLLSHAIPPLAGACAGLLVAPFYALVLAAGLTDGVATATVVASFVNCAAAGSLIARCVVR